MASYNDYLWFLPALTYANGDGSFPYWAGSVERDGSRALTYAFSNTSSADTIQITEATFAEISAFANVTFIRQSDVTELLDPSQIADNPFVGPDAHPDIWISQQTSSNPTLGGEGGIYWWYQNYDQIVDIDSYIRLWATNPYTIVHEIGHALGLKHTSPDQLPTQYPLLESSVQNNGHTVMHYVAGDPNPTPSSGEWLFEHFQLFDVYALQARFGANMAHNATATRYDQSSLGGEWMQVLWDAGGNDLLDFTKVNRNQIINLFEGGFSSVGNTPGNTPAFNGLAAGMNLTIAFGAAIETAKGGSGDDLIYGNNLNNKLWGNSGNDIIYTEGGNDTAFGGNGNDELYGYLGNDKLYGDSGNDWIAGNAGKDLLWGGTGSDKFVFYSIDQSSAKQTKADVINDFSQLESDRIELSWIDAIVGGADSAFQFIGTSAGTGAGQLNYQIVSGNTYVSAFVNADGFADFMVRLNGIFVLTVSDFVL